MAQLHTNISKETKSWLQKTARNQKRQIAGIVELALIEWLKNYGDTTISSPSDCSEQHDVPPTPTAKLTSKG